MIRHFGGQLWRPLVDCTTRDDRFVDLLDICCFEIQNGISPDLARTLRCAEHDSYITCSQKSEIRTSTEQERQAQNVSIEGQRPCHITDRDCYLTDDRDICIHSLAPIFNRG